MYDLMDELVVSRGLIRSFGDTRMLESIGLVFGKRFVKKVLDECEISYVNV